MSENTDNKNKHTYGHDEKTIRKVSHNGTWSGAGSGSVRTSFVFPEITNWHFKKYLIACEALQIDPSQEHKSEFIYQRVELVLRQFEKDFEVQSMRVMKQKELPQEIQDERNANLNAQRDAKELLNWLSEAYRTEEKLLKKYVLKCKKLIQKNRLQLSKGTVNTEFQKRWLRQDNYDFYKKANDQRTSKIILIIWLIVGATVVIGGPIATIIINNL